MQLHCPEPVSVTESPASPKPGSASQVQSPWLGLSGRLNLNYRPRGHEDEESGTEEGAGSHRQCCRWRRPRLDQLAEHSSLQALPPQVPQRSGPAQL
jgi:hypothetical protein